MVHCDICVSYYRRREILAVNENGETARFLFLHINRDKFRS